MQIISENKKSCQLFVPCGSKMGIMLTQISSKKNKRLLAVHGELHALVNNRRPNTPCSLTSIAHIFKSLMRGRCPSAASISFCASGLLAARDSRALAAFTWHKVFVLFASKTNGFTAPFATTTSWFSWWSLVKELKQAAVLACRFFDLAPEKINELFIYLFFKFNFI